MCTVEKDIANFTAIKYDAASGKFLPEEKFIAVEKCFEIRLDGKFFKKIFCSPNDLEDLIAGVIAQEKLSDSAQIFSDVKFVAKDILACADKILGELSTMHSKTNGVHSGALFDGKRILIFREDIGRHNVFDKIFGAALREKIFLGDKIIIFSGRCSAEMIQKLGRMGIPAVLAKSVPTTLAIDIAQKLGITLAARLSGGSFCIYTNPQRIVLS